MAAVELKIDLSKRTLDNYKKSLFELAEETILEAITLSRRWEPGFGATRRRNKSVVIGSYRDIKDLGNFLNDFELIWLDDELVVRFFNEASQYVLLGYVTSTGRQIPGRIPWEDLPARLDRF